MSNLTNPTPPHLAGEMRPPLTVVLINNGGGGIFSFLPIADAVPEDVFTPLWATPQHVDLAGRKLLLLGWSGAEEESRKGTGHWRGRVLIVAALRRMCQRLSLREVHGRAPSGPKTRRLPTHHLSCHALRAPVPPQACAAPRASRTSKSTPPTR